MATNKFKLVTSRLNNSSRPSWKDSVNFEKRVNHKKNKIAVELIGMLEDMGKSPIKNQESQAATSRREVDNVLKNKQQSIMIQQQILKVTTQIKLAKKKIRIQTEQNKAIEARQNQLFDQEALIESLKDSDKMHAERLLHLLKAEYEKKLVHIKE